MPHMQHAWTRKQDNVNCMQRSPTLPTFALLPHTLQSPEQQQLSKDGVVLEDAKKLADLKIENEDILAVVFAQEGGCGQYMHDGSTQHFGS